MDQLDFEVIEYITQLKISRCIKKNKNKDKKELVKDIQNIIKNKEDSISMNKLDKEQ